ncbi:hypothetical protein GCM10027285_27930 [Oleiagrimonas citrea]
MLGVDHCGAWGRRIDALGRRGHAAIMNEVPENIRVFAVRWGSGGRRLRGRACRAHEKGEQAGEQRSESMEKASAHEVRESLHGGGIRDEGLFRSAGMPGISVRTQGVRLYCKRLNAGNAV